MASVLGSCMLGNLWLITDRAVGRAMSTALVVEQLTGLRGAYWDWGPPGSSRGQLSAQRQGLRAWVQGSGIVLPAAKHVRDIESLAGQPAAAKEYGSLAAAPRVQYRTARAPVPAVCMLLYSRKNSDENS